MKNRALKLRLAPVLLALCALPSTVSTAQAQGTAFTYQGQLQNNGLPANGLYDFKFSLSNAPSGGSQIGGTLNETAIGVTNGLFVVTLDFGAVFAGNETWLAISVCSNGVGNYTPLTPLQEISPTPYAVFANTASNFAGTIPQGQLPASPTFSGTVTAGSFLSDSAFDFVAGYGNSASVGGSTVGGGEYNTASGTLYGSSTVSGGYGNQATGDYATVGGGIGNNASGEMWATVGGGVENAASADAATVGGGYFNRAMSVYTTVGGGLGNTASGDDATIGGGEDNQATGTYATVGGGGFDYATGDLATVAGGEYNSASGDETTVSGGYQNQATNYGATVPGGQNNVAGGQYSFAAGQQAKATNDGSFVWADTQNAPFTSISNDTFNVRARGGVMLATSGAGLTVDGNPVLTLQANSSASPNFDGGSSYNFVSPSQEGETIAGGGGSTFLGVPLSNSVTASWGTVGGGSHNISSGSFATVGGGYNNTASNQYATVPGGANNVAGGQFSFAAGQQAQALHPGAFVWADTQNAPFASTSSNTFNVRAQGGVSFATSGAGLTVDGNPVLAMQQNASGAPNVIAGSVLNFVAAGVVGASIGGGGATNYAGNHYSNSVTADFGTVGGGYANTAGNLGAIGGGASNLASYYGTVGGGIQNSALGFYGTVAGGISNLAQGDYGTIGGGSSNTVTGGTVGGGSGNLAADYGTVSGGESNTASVGAAVPGGFKNTATGLYSFAAGQQAQATHQGSFVWADSQDSSFASAADDSFNVRSQGGVNLATSGAGLTLDDSLQLTVGTGGLDVDTIQASPALALDSQYVIMQTTALDLGPTLGNYSVSIDANHGNISANGSVTATSFFGDMSNDFVTVSGGQQATLAATNIVLVADEAVFAQAQQMEVVLSGSYSLSSIGACSITASDLDFTGVSFNLGVADGTPTIAMDLFDGNLTVSNNLIVSNISASGNIAAVNVYGNINSPSDRNLKQNFSPLDPQAVLEKVSAMPVTLWNYKADRPETRHIGPMAQDFHAAFGLNGDDDKHINVVDEGGVALAAIQGVNQKVEDLKSENARLKEQNARLQEHDAALEKRLEALEKMVQSLAAK